MILGWCSPPVVWMGYCKDVNHDWGCLCGDQQQISPYSVNEPWISHWALGHFCCSVLITPNMFKYIIHLILSALKELFVSVIILSWSPYYKCAFKLREKFKSVFFKEKRAPVAIVMILCDAGLRVLNAIYVILYDTGCETAEGSDTLVCCSAMMEKCARWDMSSTRIIHLHHCHVLKKQENKKQGLETDTRVLTELL